VSLVGVFCTVQYHLISCYSGASSNQEKQYYEKLVECLGGKTVQSVTPDTSFVLAISPNHVAVTNMVSSFQKYVVELFQVTIC